MYGSIYIIPDEEKILQEEFHRKVISNHLDCLKEFSDTYKLGYKFRIEEYQDAPCFIARDGHLVIKEVNDSGLVVCYLPINITDRQITWMQDHKQFIENHKLIGAFLIDDMKNPTNSNHVTGFENVMKEVVKRNMLYNRKEVDENVRKKI
jgi:sugar phosphate isomerase/epimerase